MIMIQRPDHSIKAPPNLVILLLFALGSLVLVAGCDIGNPETETNAQTIAEATVTSTPQPPSATPVQTETPTAVPFTPTPLATATATQTVVPSPTVTDTPEPPPTGSTVVVNGVAYDAYVPAATKKHQVYHYSCEFDAAWAVLMTYGFDVSLEEQLAIVGVDESVEPYYKETADGIVIYGGDIIDSYSGSYKTNFLARTTGFAMRRVFEHYGLSVSAVRNQKQLKAALQRGELVWIKTTADFKPGKPATWIMPDGRTYGTVLGNDHAAVVMGYNSDGALIRDVLGPTSTNWNREYEYEVPWPRFLAAWGSQQYDGLAVAPPGSR